MRTAVLPGDTIVIPEVLTEYQDSIELTGHVQRPGRYELTQDMRLTDLIPSARYLLSGADAGYVLVRREDARTRRVQIKSADLEAAWRDRRSPHNLLLRPSDRIIVFDSAFDRSRILEPILAELQLQSHIGAPHQVVEISGEVKAPGVYPLEPGMRISDLIRAGGRLSEAAYAYSAELARYEVVDGQYRESDVQEINLAAIMNGSETADVELEAHDYLNISVTPDWDSQWTVTLRGEVRFPGTYRVRRGETLSSVLERAGGLTDEAFARGAVFLRDSLREREREQIARLVQRLESDLASLSLQSVDTTGSETLATGRALLQQLRESEAVGRLVIDLESITANGNAERKRADVQLRNGDELLVPVNSQVVTVIGEVQQSTSHLYADGHSLDNYLELSGGLTRRADKGQIYVVRASGAVVADSRSRWFGRKGNRMSIMPGDTIVVPFETDRIRPLTFWTNVSQIFYQSAIAVAAIRTFDN